MKVLGWRELVAMPHLGVHAIKAKVDTGARTSAVQAFDLRTYTRDGQERIRFRVLPEQEDPSPVECDVPLLEYRWIKDSGGHATYRPVVRTPVRIGEAEHDIELSLATRADMGFRMLLGREALRGRYLVDPALSYAASTGASD